VDAAGNVYVATFGFTASGPVSSPGEVIVFDHSGRLLRQVSVAGASPNLLGMAFHPVTQELLVIDFGHSQVLRVDSVSGASTPFVTLPTPLPHPKLGAGLNDLTFDRAGNVYVSDSFQGIIWRAGPTGGQATVWVDSDLLRTTGVPPFGANGLRFNKNHTALFVANTGDDRVIKIPVRAERTEVLGAGTPEVFVNSINGADGLIIDDDDNLWVVANQADEIVVVNPKGQAIAKLGDFGGIDSDGAPVGLLFPASLHFGGEFVYISNLSLDLRLFNPAFAAVDSPWAKQVTTYTVSRIRARIPPVPGLPESEER
jgi:sugar lactone lactonase YvrE